MIFFKRYCSPSLCYGAALYRQIKTQNVQENVNYLCKYLNISENEAQYLTMKQPVIAKLNKERLKSLVESVNEIGFSNEVLAKEPSFFGILPITLKFRHKVLKECGIENVTPTLLTTYLTVMKHMTIGELKKSQSIATHINVENRLARYMTQWPTSLTTLIYEDVDKLTLYSLRLKIIQRYLELVLDLTNEAFYRGIETYPTIKHRPLEYINDTLSILQSEIMIPNYKIKSNIYLIHADPENLKNIIYQIRSIGGIDIKEVIRMHPKIALRNCQTLQEMKRLLEQYGINNEAQRRCFDIYTLSPDSVKERLEKAKNMPEFSLYYNHPRFLKMIHYNNTARTRLNKLYENNKKCLSLNILSGSAAHYEVFEKASGDKLGKGKDLIFCISQAFGKKIKKSHIQAIIQRHPFWVHTPLVSVKYVYDQLSIQFSDHDICENCPILLYPWKKVKDILNMLRKKNLQEHYPIFHDNFNFEDLSNSQKLSLVLYIMEKNHYFSGNGVWLEERSKNGENT